MYILLVLAYKYSFDPFTVLQSNIEYSFQVLFTIHNWVKVVHYFSFIKIYVYTRLFHSVKTNFARLGLGHISPSKNVGATLSNFLSWIIYSCFVTIALIIQAWIRYTFCRLKTWRSTSRNKLWHLRFRIFSHLNNLNFLAIYVILV